MLVATASHCALPEYTTGQKITVRFSPYEYWGKFCPSTVIDCINAEGIALINYPWWGCFIPPPPQRCSSAIIDAPQSLSALVNPSQRSSIPVGAPESSLVPWYFIPPSILPFLSALSLRMGTPKSPPQPWLRAPLLHSSLFSNLPFRCFSAWKGCTTAYALLNPHRRSLAGICTP